MLEIQIAPSILSANFAELGQEVRDVDAAGADVVHIDVMDGHFVPNLTLGPPVLSAVRKVTKKVLDVHLMIENADRYIEAFAQAGADWITVHVEACTHIHRTLQCIKTLGCKAGVVLNPATSLSSLEYILDEIDLVTLMSVNPGFGGQSFISSSLKKADRLRQMLDKGGYDVSIEMDGGISVKTIAQAAEAGVNIFVAGSAVYGAKNYRQVIADLRTLALEGAARRTAGGE